MDFKLSLPPILCLDPQGRWRRGLAAKSVVFSVSLEELPDIDRRLLPLLQAAIELERSGVDPSEIDRAVERVYARIDRTDEQLRLHREFCSALKEVREQLRQNGTEGTCQLADTTPVVTH